MAEAAVGTVEIASVPEADSGEAGTRADDLGAGHKLVSGAVLGEVAHALATEVVAAESPRF
jgi:hypothetical protein